MVTVIAYKLLLPLMKIAFPDVPTANTYSNPLLLDLIFTIAVTLVQLDSVTVTYILTVTAYAYCNRSRKLPSPMFQLLKLTVTALENCLHRCSNRSNLL